MRSAISSSISSSEWRRFVATLLATAGATLLVVYGLLVLLDPFDAGRLTPLSVRGLPASAPRLAVASLGRDPAFDAAIVGNSTVQLLDPERLGALTGRRFVQLSIPGTGPVEQLLVLDYFRRMHGTASAVVLGFDSRWCDYRGPLARDRIIYPFPFWLLAPSTLDYLSGALAFENFEAAWRRIGMLVGRAPRHRADGYDDFDTGRPYEPMKVRRALEEDAKPAPPAEPDDPVEPKMAALAEALAAYPAATPKVIVVPPEWSPPEFVRPSPTECEREAGWVAARVPNTTVVELDPDWPPLHREESFRDPVHYRHPIAEVLEARIAEAVSRAGAR